MSFKFPFNFSNTTNNNNNNNYQFDPLKVIIVTLALSGIIRVILESMTVNPESLFYDQYITLFVSSGKIFGYGLWALAIFLFVKLIGIKISKND